MFQTIFIDPIYNVLVFLLNVIPGGDFGLAIVILTLLVRAVFYPLFTSSIRTQMAMQAVQPELAQLQEQYKDDRLEFARKQQELFKKHRIRPLATIGTTIVQIAVFISLYYVFFRFGLPHIRTEALYPFVHAPATVDERFLGLFDLTAARTVGNAALAAVVAGLQYAVLHLSLARTAAPQPHLPPEKQMAQRMQRQLMLYLFPLLMLGVVFFAPAAVGLYFVVSNIISLGQEWLIRRKPL